MKHSNLAFSFLLLAFLGCGRPTEKLEGQKIIYKKSTDTVDIIKGIDRYKHKIDSQKQNLDSLLKDIYESSEGGTLKIFFKVSDTLKKEITYYGETGQRSLGIYLKEGSPVLINDVIINYEKPIYSSSDVSIKSKTTNIYYVHNKSELIYWTKNNQVMPASLYNEQAENLIKELYRYIGK